MLIPLTSSNRVMGIVEISSGNLNSSVIHPREVFSTALVMRDAGIILAHNHPSGNPEPSSEDIAVTRKLVETGKILDIPVYDHLIKAGNTFTPFCGKKADI
jgi:DNA repair protein RadC